MRGPHRLSRRLATTSVAYSSNVLLAKAIQHGQRDTQAPPRRHEVRYDS